MKTEGDFARFSRFTSYGLGWQVHDYRGVTCLSHGGAHTGFRARCMMVPDKKLGVFVLCNMGPSAVPEIVTKTAIDTLLGLAEEDWGAFHRAAHNRSESNVAAAKKKRDAARKPDTKPSLPLKAYVGAYDEPAYGRIDVTLKNDALIGRYGKFVFRLDHYHFDTFTAVPVEPRDDAIASDRRTVEWHFRLGANGQMEELKGFGGQVFKKVAAKK
jgi:hypothetical protein